ncbi:hypothetical protein MMC25_006632 [Agyrium rufum]|nr:hypothetical protein [Agyrium rufum]
MSPALDQIRALTANIPQDAGERKKLLEAAQKLTLALESTEDTIMRIAYGPVPSTVARIGHDMKLFESLTNSDKALSTKELAAVCKADEVLTGRILRYLASVDMVEETGEDSWESTKVTKVLANPGLVSGLVHNFDCHLPPWTLLPEYLREIKFQNPSNPADCAFQRGHHTDKLPWFWIGDYPHLWSNFNVWMSTCREGQNLWYDIYPFEKKFNHNLTLETPLFVDIAGGIGHQCVELKKRYPNIQGRIILEELPPVLEQSIPAEGVEKVPYDFFTPQPIKGARIYYMRNVIHDHPDERAVKILENVKAAMDKDSVIVIDDIILPNKGAHWQATELDVTMMSGLAAMERSEKQWYSLMKLAGLRVLEIVKYTETLGDSVIIAVPE